MSLNNFYNFYTKKMGYRYVFRIRPIIKKPLDQMIQRPQFSLKKILFI